MRKEYLVCVTLHWHCECPTETKVGNLKTTGLLVDEQILGFQIPESKISLTSVKHNE